MGEYYNWVNLDKKEYISPYDFDYGNKSLESMYKGNVVLGALRTLLGTEWKGSRIVWLGDECTISGNIAPDLFDLLQSQAKKLSSSDYIFDAISASYRNVSCLFKESEKIARDEINYILEDLYNGTLVVNEYGISLENPFNELFQRTIQSYKYTINYTKQVCYSFDNTKIVYPDGSPCDNADPLPLLMGYGRILEPGKWLGDIIGVADEIDDSIQILDKIILNM